MTARRIEIERLELRLPAGALKSADRSPAALHALARAVGAHLAARAANGAIEGPAPRSIEVFVPGGAGNPGRIAAAIDRRMRRPAASLRKGGR
jgi:hypothetical protein